MESYCSCHAGSGRCSDCLWRMTYRWSMIVCTVTALVYFVLAHFGKLPLAGAFGISRWWDVVGVVVFVPLTVQVIDQMGSTDTGNGQFIGGLVVGWLAGIILLYTNGCLAGFIAVPAGFLSVLAVFYFFKLLGGILGYMGDKIGWWLVGAPSPKRASY